MQGKNWVIIALFICSHSAAAQTYKSGTQFTYDPQRNVRTTVVNEPLQYNADEYPSAQGHYLSAPLSTRSANVTASVQPSPLPQPQLVQPQPVRSTQIVQPVQPIVQPVQPVAQPFYMAPQRPLVVAQAPYVKAAEPMQYLNQAPASNLVFKKAAPPISLGTLNGFEFGAQGSWYRYQEHVVAETTFMHIDGGSAGLTVDANKVFNDDNVLELTLSDLIGRSAPKKK